MDNRKTGDYARQMKPYSVSVAKRETLTLGIGSIVLAVALIILAGVIWAFIALGGGIVGEPAYLIVAIVLFVAIYLGIAAVIMLRCRRYLREEMLNAGIVNGAACAECHGIFNVQSMVAINGLHVCARCKPILLQKLAEGAIPK
jgi:hypothetical protein